MPEQDGPGRRPKYRVSCDICHAAKIKCGSQKPSCRRCSVKKLECVYSVSHRKGRPREKRKGPEEGAENAYSLPEPMEVAETWTPPTTDFEVPVTIEPSEAAPSQPAAECLAFSTAFAPFEMDDSFDFATILGSVNDTETLDGRHQDPTGSIGQVGNRDLTSPEVQESNDHDIFRFLDTQALLQPDQFSQAGFTSFLGNVPSFDQALDDGFDVFRNDQFDATQEQRRGKDQFSRNPTYPSPSEEIPSLFEDGTRRDSSRANCECFPTLLRHIRLLKSKQKTRGLIPIGSVLVLERETNDCLSRLHRCKGCNEDSVSYLLAMVSARIVLDLMQKTVHDEFMKGNRRASQSSGTGRSRLLGDQSSDPHRVRGQRDESSLYIGNFKVPARARRRYLREMLQARFSKFLMLVKEREKLVNGVGQDCFAEGAAALMGNISRDLKTMLGWVELWSSKD